jgi:hypothetical protein
VHYYPDDMEKYAACPKHPGQDFQGEITEEILKAGKLRRLMYNEFCGTQGFDAAIHRPVIASHNNYRTC